MDCLLPTPLPCFHIISPSLSTSRNHSRINLQEPTPVRATERRKREKNHRLHPLQPSECREEERTVHRFPDPRRSSVDTPGSRLKPPSAATQPHPSEVVRPLRARSQLMNVPTSFVRSPSCFLDRRPCLLVRISPFRLTGIHCLPQRRPPAASELCRTGRSPHLQTDSPDLHELNHAPSEPS